jgi:hypothetical protein
MKCIINRVIAFIRRNNALNSATAWSELNTVMEMIYNQEIIYSGLWGVLLGNMRLKYEMSAVRVN